MDVHALVFEWEEDDSCLYVRDTKDDPATADTRLRDAWITIARRWTPRGADHPDYSALCSAFPEALAASLNPEEWEALGLEPVLPTLVLVPAVSFLLACWSRHNVYPVVDVPGADAVRKGAVSVPGGPMVEITRAEIPEPLAFRSLGRLVASLGTQPTRFLLDTSSQAVYAEFATDDGTVMWQLHPGKPDARNEGS